MKPRPEHAAIILIPADHVRFEPEYDRYVLSGDWHFWADLQEQADRARTCSDPKGPEDA